MNYIQPLNKPRRTRFALTALLAPLAFTGCAGLGASRHVPQSTQAQLPIHDSLAEVCSGKRLSKARAERLRQEGKTLVRELRVHPDWLVTVTRIHSDPGPGNPRYFPQDITVHELAADEIFGTGCMPALRSKLREAL
jgi:hypothetical protein